MTTYGIDRSASAGSGGSTIPPFPTLVDPNQDRIIFWDDSAGDFAFMPDATVPGYAIQSNAAGVLSWGPAGGEESKRRVTQSTHGFSVGNVLYYTGTVFAVADKDSSATAEVVGIVDEVVDTNTFTLLYGGYIDSLSGLVAGTVYFLGDSGALTATEPSTVGQISKPLLIATSTTAGYFFNMRGSVVGSASSTLSVENFSGDNSTVAFTLASSPLENNTFVMVEGVYQQKNTYSISGTTLTFSTAPPTGTNNIEVITVGSVNIGTATALSGDALNVRGECRFDRTSTSVCTLNRFNGKYLFINGANETIPSTAPTLSNGALGANDTTYYVYAYMSAGVMTLEASATAYATDGTYGHKIKSGDATRTLVGMVRKTGGNFADSITQRFTLSWFNRRTLPLLDSNRTAVTTTPTEMALVYFLTWGDEGVHASGGTSAYNTTGADNLTSLLRLDGTTTYGTTHAQNGNSLWGNAHAAAEALLSEGYHYFAAYCSVAVYNTADSYNQVAVSVRG